MITIPADVRDYLDAVRARLDDLPAEEREDLLADVEPSVLESAQDTDAPVAQRLGPPERFADDLRAAAGLPPRADAAPAAASRRPTLRELAARVQPPDWLRELAPLWWVARAVVLLGVVAEASGSFDGQGLLPGDGTRVLLPVAVLASVGLGLLRHHWRAAVVALNVVCALAAIPVALGIAANIRDNDALSSTQRMRASESAVPRDLRPTRPVTAAVRERRARNIAEEAARQARARRAAKRRVERDRPGRSRP